MNPNTESSVSLPFGKYGEIKLAKTREIHDAEDGVKTVVSFSAKGLPFRGENFDILQEKLRTLYGFQNVIVEPDDEDVAINITFDCKVAGRVRNPKGLIRSTRKKLQRAMGQSYKCLHCLDRVLDYCPDCEKRKRDEALGDYLDLKGELNRNDEEEEEEDISEYWKSWSCDQCGEPWDECVCNPDDEPHFCYNCDMPDDECICEESKEEDD